jgi:O-antigen ligase
LNVSFSAEVVANHPRATANPLGNAAYALYLLYCGSFFLRFPARVTALAAIRFDLLLMAAILFCLIFSGLLFQRNGEPNRANRILTVLSVYIVLSLPFVQWPGSVIHTNSLIFIKAVMFFYMSVLTLTTVRRVQIFMMVFVSCQVVRILEPLYLNLTSGYWGSGTHLGGGEVMTRLAGSPYDTINPNGLAFVITSALPLLYFLYIKQGGLLRLGALALLPLLLYTLVLTASRTGMIALFIVLLGIAWKSKHRFALLALIAVGTVIGFASLSEVQQERYLSLVQRDVRGAETAQGRIEGTIRDFEVALTRPFFGHGLGTSAEANFHATGVAQLSHNLFAEVAQELGFIGLAIFLLYILAVLRNFNTARRQTHVSLPGSYLARLTDAMQVWMIMNLVFSLASYGLSSYEWYLFGGISVALVNLTTMQRDEGEDGNREEYKNAADVEDESESAV